jgi:hypothetical protein
VPVKKVNHATASVLKVANVVVLVLKNQVALAMERIASAPVRANAFIGRKTAIADVTKIAAVTVLAQKRLGRRLRFLKICKFSVFSTSKEV